MRSSYIIIQILGVFIFFSGLYTVIRYLMGEIPKMAQLTAVTFMVLGICIAWLAFSDLKRETNGRG
jgi:hypothetical protein